VKTEVSTLQRGKGMGLAAMYLFIHGLFKVGDKLCRLHSIELATD
jgi:hypothetical protein